jgi:oligoendopeptidase F
MNNVKTYQKREDVPKEFTWNLSDLYKNIDDWKKDFDTLTEAIPVLESYKSTLLNSSKELLEFFEFQDNLTLRINRFYNYAARKADEDTSNTTYQGYKDQAASLMVKISCACSFIEPKLLSIPDEVLEKFYEGTPKLLTYKRYITDVRRKKSHILSNEEEKILAAAGEIASAPSDIYGLLNNADLTFSSVTDIEGNRLPVTHASFIPLMSNYDRNVRKDAFDSMYKTYDHHKNTSAAMLSAQMKQLGFFAKLRRYDSPLDAALDETGVDTNVYYNLIETVHKNMDLMYKYVRLRKKLLKYDDLHMYDLYVPIVRS